jgi:AbrB family looped-hinge helix DNA binding protein
MQIDSVALSPYPSGMEIARFKVSERGQMALPAEVRRRWGMSEGGIVEIADLGGALLIVPGDQDGLRGLLAASIEEVGGYQALVAEVIAEEPGLA